MTLWGLVVKMEEKRCLRCGKVLEIRIGAKRINPKRKFCDKVCQTRFVALAYHYKYFERDKEKKKVCLKKWYKNNKERQAKNVMNDYYRNKSKWNERSFVTKHRKQILEIISPNCFKCGKKEIKEIHHETYDIERPNTTISYKEFQKVLLDYCKHLKGFCSRQCHKDYERQDLALSPTPKFTKYKKRTFK